MKNELKELVDHSLPEILSGLTGAGPSSENISYDIERPKIKAHGDLSINLAFQLGRLLKKNPLEIAIHCQKILLKAVQKNDSWRLCVKDITVEKPGFLNFRLTERSLVEELIDIGKSDQSFGRSNVGQGVNVLIEFVSANPTGPLTIAHGRQAAIGDTLARIMNAVGYDVHKEFYLNDSGRQIRLLGESLWIRYRALFGFKEDLPEEGYRGAYLIDLAAALKEKQGDKLLKAGKEKSLAEVTHFAVDSMMREIKGDLKKLDVTFDQYFSESSLLEQHLIDRVFKELQENGLSYEAEGALWFRSTRFGDDKDRVLKKQTGEYTYLAPDIAYHRSKFERGFQKLVNLWGPDHHGYVPRLQAACQALGYSKEALTVLIVQLATLYRKGEPVRMSTRAGEFVTLSELVEEVGPDAARFFFLMRKIESHLDFDLELAKQKTEDNPVYYLQYAHARISSILAYAKRAVERDADLSLIQEEEAYDLIKKMAEYPEILKQASEILEPYRVVDYLRELAALFHKFYALHRIVTPDEALTKARLFLTDSVRIVLRNGLSILGVSAPSKM